MILSHIVAVSENEVIGKDNSLLWKFPEDMQYFKKRTMGKIMIMGRKTFDSFGKPLPKRFHIVISRSAIDSQNEMVKYVGSVKEAYALAEKMSLNGQWPEEIMVVGGAQIYKETLPFANKMEITMIEGIPENADAFFPEIDWGNWELIQEKSHKIDENHCVNFSYKTYKRKELATI